MFNDEYIVGLKGIYCEVVIVFDDYCGCYVYLYCVMINLGLILSWYSDGYYWNGIDWGDLSFDNDGVFDEGLLIIYLVEIIGLLKVNNEYILVEFSLDYCVEIICY